MLTRANIMAIAHDDKTELRLTHSLRAIFVVGLVSTILVWGGLSMLPFDVLKKGTYVFLSLLMVPFALLGNVFIQFNSVTELKELSFKEHERIKYIAETRQQFVIKTALIYAVLTLAACIFIYLGQGDTVNIIAASVTSGICAAGIYSSIVALYEWREISRFKSKIIRRSNARAKSEAIQKKTAQTATNK